MINRLLPIFALGSMLAFGSCSTSKLAQTDVNDDVYYSTAKAKEAVVVANQPSDVPAERERGYVTDRDVYADEDSYSGYYDDYSVRINRFHRYSPWRSYYDSYYDPYYSYHPYSYNRYHGHGARINIYLGGGYGYGYHPYWDNHYYWGYGHPYRHNYWGLHSYYNSYPYYGGYYGNNGYYYGGMGRDIQSSPNYRPRPNRDFNMPNARRTEAPGGSGYTPGNNTVTDRRSRTERYNDGNRVTPPASTGRARPEPSPARPTRTSTAPQRTSDDSRDRNQSRPTRVESNYPPSNSGSSSGSSSGRSSGGSSSSARPTRGN